MLTVHRMETNEELLTVPEVAAQLRTVPSTIRYWRHVGYGPKGIKIGRRILYRRADVNAWIESQSGIDSTPEGV